MRVESQARLDHCVDRLLNGYDWTLSLLNNKILGGASGERVQC